jgi:membrane protein
MREAMERGRRFAAHDVWRIGRPGEEVPHSFIIQQVRAAILLARSVAEETLVVRAAALSFATLIFLVPFLAFMFAFIQAFNLGDQVYDAADAQLTRLVGTLRQLEVVAAPPGTDGSPSSEKDPKKLPANDEALKQRLIAWVFPTFDQQQAGATLPSYENPVRLLVRLAEESATKPQALGITGVLFVLSTVFGFMRNVEQAFNRIWGVRRTRGVLRALSDYLLVTVLLPFAAAAVLGVTAALESTRLALLLGPFAVLLRSSQFLIIASSFCLVYWVVPNTRVKFRYALLGGLVAGLLWVTMSWGYIKFQFGLAQYALFFSTFALFPLFLLWIYTSWLILLFGAVVAYAYQNEKTFAMERLAGEAPFAYREAVAVRTMIEICRRFTAGSAPLTVQEAAESWNVPTRLLMETLDCLTSARLTTACADPAGWQPARAPECIKVRDVVTAMREQGKDPSLFRRDKSFLPLFALLERADQDLLDATMLSLSGTIPPLHGGAAAIISGVPEPAPGETTETAEVNS